MPETETEETREAIKRREEIYSLLIEVVAYLHQMSGTDENRPPNQQNPTMSPAGFEIERNRFINFILDSNDELAQMTLFRFLVDKHLESLVMVKKNPLFERFISR